MNYNSYETGYNTSYGAGGGTGGGGFVPGEGSQQSPGGRRDYSKDNLRPVTVKQIKEAQVDSGDVFKIDNAVVSQITFVGQICNISAQATHTTYKLDDGTGSVEVKQYIDSDAVDQPNPNKAKLVEGAYCRAWGKLNHWNDRRYVASQIIRPIEDMNEVSYHLLEATAIHLYFTRPAPGAANAGAAATNGGAGQQQAAGGGNHGDYDLRTCSPMAKKVFQQLREMPQTNEGIHQQVIAAQLKMDMSDIAAAGVELQDSGLIYTTVDDQTWAILEPEH
ncbi:replication protein A, subunit RPA32 [Cucurbitaria berberidis CBS 394.84]|uniref:Replication protein A, subunit RPA32 n=1 Tax=Cucurbitaria berberidis CBS 394.84 TaxID=1168544 RepID=A0A9P4L411_9PLEO|nr:replication protein A, subunit RPA32 [Cucurbitaria berberidis CBS 394.84]KAF1840832.1 replication protein A, subunit RPA32 [Cucurbitaria berberidis CBS 394.84]